jgi:FkbM family methyltransferase
MDDKGKVKMNALDFLKFELKRIYIKSLQKWDENILFSQKWNENLEKLGIARETLRKILPSSIKKTIRFYFSTRSANCLYEVDSFEKKWALDFLIYIIEKNPKVPLEFFHEEDQKEVKKFMRNKILCSLFDYIPKEDLFDESDVKKQREWEEFLKKNKIKKRKNYYEFLGFKSLIHQFEPSVFLGKHGIDYLNQKNRIKNSVIIDCGACIGDSAFVLNNELKPKEIICIEPNEENFKILRANMKLNNIKNARLFKIALGEKKSKGEIKIPTSIGGSYIVETEKGKVDISTIDDLIFNELNLQNIGLIKMDIEGYELLALKGAERTIKEFKPTLILSLYHKGQDFFEIPFYLKFLVPEYKFRFVNTDFNRAITERILISEV